MVIVKLPVLCSFKAVPKSLASVANGQTGNENLSARKTKEGKILLLNQYLYKSDWDITEKQGLDWCIKI